jgi:hypothetical protein
MFGIMQLALCMAAIKAVRTTIQTRDVKLFHLR